jgi:hypothetical protein
VAGSFRKLAAKAVDQAIQDKVCLLEIDFPPFAISNCKKSQFDDFDNLQELIATGLCRWYRN